MAESAAEEFDRLWQVMERNEADEAEFKRMHELWPLLSAEERHRYNVRWKAYLVERYGPQRPPES